MRISHPTLRLRIAAAACVASSPNMIDRANCSGCSCSVRLHHAALPPPDAGAEVPDRGARNAGCNRNPQSHWAWIDRRRNAAMRRLQDVQPTPESNIDSCAARLRSAAGAPAPLVLCVRRENR